jgi:hypothetical protein
MKTLQRLAVLALGIPAAMLATALAGPAAAQAATTAATTTATTTYSDWASGAEYYATSTEGRFTGTATGQLPGAWQATVDHTPLSPNGTVTGGSFALTTAVQYVPTYVYGKVVGGSVTRNNPGATGCVDQYYTVDLMLGQVTANGSGSGYGSFVGTLVHHRHSVFGYCLTYAATISGPLSLTF